MDDIFSPLARYVSIRFLLALAVRHDMYIHQMAALCAYLNGGSWTENVYTQQPEIFEVKDGIYVDDVGHLCRQ